MEYKLKNLSAMPLDVPTLAGPVILPANGEITADLGALDAAVMEQSPYVEISESKAKAKAKPQLDHDGDGKAGGSKPSSERGEDIDAMRSEYEELTGEKPDMRWGENRLRDEIDAKLAE